MRACFAARVLHRAIAFALLTWAAAGAARAATFDVHYVAYAAGFRVLDITGSISLDARGYKVDLDFRTVGLFGLLVDGSSHTTARGVWQGAATVPALYDSRGRWDGQVRQTTIDYQDGQPVIRALLPANDREREPVAAALQANTLDSLSAMAALLRVVQTTGSCDGAARIFDGRRLSQIWVRTGGPEVLPASARSMFQGPTLRCDFEGRLLAGFKYGDDRARAARPQRGSAWLASMSVGGPMLPVRIRFSTRFFGDATMYLAR